MTELVFLIEEGPEGAYTARALGESIFTQAETRETLERGVRDAVRCHFERQEDQPVRIRLRRVPRSALPKSLWGPEHSQRGQDVPVTPNNPSPGAREEGNAALRAAGSGASRPRSENQVGPPTARRDIPKSIGQSNAALGAAVPGASRPRFGEVTIRDRGRLPHWEAEGAIYFVTFRLADSLPQSLLESLRAERNDIINTAKQMGRGLSAAETGRLAQLSSRRIEAYLDSGRGGCHLRSPSVAQLMATALRHFEGKRYRLFAWCVMPNHVHVVFRPLPSYKLADILRTWKSYTARRANQILHRHGTFWQREYYDRLIRDDKELQRTIQYVIQNPANAGLRDWPWVWTCGQDAHRPADRMSAVHSGTKTGPGARIKGIRRPCK
jgi:REP element-mobilizing transposase RayT